ncbi:hypothetical protein E1295_44375, partial [Nonomuraea mesophila]
MTHDPFHHADQPDQPDQPEPATSGAPATDPEHAAEPAEPAEAGDDKGANIVHLDTARAGRHPYRPDDPEPT